MKRLIEIVMAIKSFACMSFTGFVMVYVVISWFFGQRGLSFSLLWQFLALSLLVSTLQFIFFSGNVVKKMNYAWRLVWFVLPLYLGVSAFALLFGWFPLRPGSWLVFTAIFLVIFAVLVVALELYCRLTGRQYNQLLDAYKSRQGS